MHYTQEELHKNVVPVPGALTLITCPKVCHTELHCPFHHCAGKVSSVVQDIKEAKGSPVELRVFFQNERPPHPPSNVDMWPCHGDLHCFCEENLKY